MTCLTVIASEAKQSPSACYARRDAVRRGSSCGCCSAASAAAAPARARRTSWRSASRNIPSTLNPAHRRDGGEELCPRHGAPAAHHLSTRDWQLVCMLCVTLPSFENGLAEKLDLPGGKTGVRAHLSRSSPSALGRRRAGDDRGRAASATRSARTPRPASPMPSSIAASSRSRRRTPRPSPIDVDKLTFDYAAINDFEILPAHIERAAFADPAQYRIRTRYDTDPTNPGPLLRALPHHRGVARLAYRARAQSRPGGAPSPISAASSVWTIENTAALEANLLARRHRHGGGRAGLLARRGAGLREAPRRASSASSTSPASPTSMSISISTIRSSPTGACARRCSTPSTARRSATSSSPGAIRSPTASCRRSTGSTAPTCRITPTIRRRRARCSTRRAGTRRRRRPPQRGRRAAGARARHHLRQPHARAGRGGAAEPVARGRHRRAPQEPAGARPVRRQPDQPRNSTMAMFAWISAPESVPRSSCAPTRSRPPTNGWSGENFAGFRNAEADRLIDAIEVELDRDRRAPTLWHRLEALYAEELPALPLYFRAEAYRAAALARRRDARPATNTPRRCGSRTGAGRQRAAR